MYTYIKHLYEKTRQHDLLIFAALRLQEFKGSILISIPAVAQIIVNVQSASFLSPNGTRTELKPKFLDIPIPNNVSSHFHTRVIMETHGNHTNRVLTLKHVSNMNGNRSWINVLTSETRLADARRSQ